MENLVGLSWYRTVWVIQLKSFIYEEPVASQTSWFVFITFGLPINIKEWFWTLRRSNSRNVSIQLLDVSCSEWAVFKLSLLDLCMPYKQPLMALQASPCLLLLFFLQRAGLVALNIFSPWKDLSVVVCESKSTASLPLRGGWAVW